MSPTASVSRIPTSFAEPSTATPPSPPVAAPDPDSAFQTIDRSTHAAIARWTGGLSPAAILLAFADWQLHLAASPGKQLALTHQAFVDTLRFAEAWVPRHPEFQPWSVVKAAPNDHRFADPDWELPAFNMMAQAFLLGEQWWHSATSGVHGLARPNAAIVDFALRQLLDTAAPSNFPLTNPEVLRTIMESGGGNFVSGLHNWLEDCKALFAGGKPGAASDFVIGKTVAATKGKVVYRNELIELIQYAPTTAVVRPEPVLIVPAWIMKYYILDLAPQDSLVRYLVDNGFTVFIISWKNPTSDDRNLSLEDYRKLGVEAAIEAVNEMVPKRPIHAAGYCLGGTLLAIEAARLGRVRPEALRSVTLLAAQTDFTEAGELTLFINESQVAFLEDMMWQRGVLDAGQMAGAFQMLRSNDLIWSRVVRDYLMGEREPLSDLMAWNADATRMPYRMHSEYLRQLFLNNDLAEGRYRADGVPVALSDLRMPMFVVGTQYDHVAPWRSTHKIHFLADAPITYVLASGGHNAGIVAPPTGEEGRSYQILARPVDGSYVGPEEWLKQALHVEGSWWTAWRDFLGSHSGEPVSPPPLGGSSRAAALDDAPGRYVLQC
ncbi:alpha/beta fold hydrolase [Bradyrhizobium sp. NP1]|uniref:PHA/PHB synthase family protein n=1 Tax=Bradyrhizobium sp. NP1 TaxID=3049772 RepID=UPI0025A63973|nr:alpha/beta fold hydrolase [Bradyrhizobium sp. NP1]WJR78206.1 alpha/beta fold hydrolase [Bradyrhizobium sp. NP1]